ncbi:MAG: hypothetical protein H0V41_04795 [Pseudonocardiales bacterium]|nr:hypothetical protein [Pseudonocardiales bacterium]
MDAGRTPTTPLTEHAAKVADLLSRTVLLGFLTGHDNPNGARYEIYVVQFDAYPEIL